MVKKKRKAKDSVATKAARSSISDKEASKIMYKALDEIIGLLGPRILSCASHCIGCEYEMRASLGTAYRAFDKLGVKHVYSDHPLYIEEMARLKEIDRLNNE